MTRIINSIRVVQTIEPHESDDMSSDDLTMTENPMWLSFEDLVESESLETILFESEPTTLIQGSHVSRLSFLSNNKPQRGV